MNYKVYQGDELKQTVTSKTAVMNGLQPNKTYDFSVEPDNGQTGADGKTRYFHTAYANSSNGKNGFYVGGGTNLVSGTSQEYTMGYGVPNTMWENGYAFATLPLVSGFIGDEILPQDPHTFFYTLIQGTTYTQTVWFETDATVKDLSVAQITWYTNAGHDWQPARVQKLGQNSYKVVSTYTWPGKSDNSVRLFDIGQLGSAFDLSTGTYLKFGKLKLEEGSVSTGWSPTPSEAHPIYIGTYTDLTQTDSTNPLDYTWNPIRDGDATRDGTKETVSVTTRGIQFNIPKTLTVGSTITLRYEEYPLGIVPIGNEPSGYFGGGNKQNLSATVISTANGSSVVEVAGNVIEVGGRNLLQGTVTASGDVADGGGNQVKGAFNGCDAVKTNSAWDERHINLKSSLGRTNAKAGDWFTISVYVKADKQIDTGSLGVYRALGNVDAIYNDGSLDIIQMSNKPIITQWQQYSWSFQINDISLQREITRVEYNNDTGDNWIYWAGWMLEPGTIATPYAAFVDGDTFTAQPDGTFALFSEHKALYY